MQRIMTQGAAPGAPSPATAGLTQQALVNVMWCLDACIFLSSHSAEGQGRNVAGQGAGEKIEELGPENVVLVVTDNAAVCVKAGRS
jgi:hypothetical protein